MEASEMRTSPRDDRSKARDYVKERRRDEGFAEMEPTTALENLRCLVVDVFAVAQAARQAADRLPWAATQEERRAIGKVQALVNLTARVATEVLDDADTWISSLRGRPRSRTG